MIWFYLMVSAHVMHAETMISDLFTALFPQRSSKWLSWNDPSEQSL